MDDETSLRLHYISHCALDVTDERLALTKRARWAPPAAARCALLTHQPPQDAGPAVFEPYQGLIYPVEDFRVYGYITCTRVKLLITVDDTAEVRDADMADAFRRLAAAYADAASNPFQTPGEPLHCRSFAAAVEAIAHPPRLSSAAAGSASHFRSVSSVSGSSPSGMLSSQSAAALHHRSASAAGVFVTPPARVVMHPLGAGGGSGS